MISELITHLQNNTTVFNTIQDGWLMNTFDESADNTPALFVMLTGDEAEPSTYDNHIKQKVNTIVTIVYILKGVDLEDARKEVSDALLGYEPVSVDDTIDVMERNQGDLGEIRGLYITWADTYSFTSYIKQT